MRILHLSLTPLVGAPQRICRALNLHDGVESRHAVLSDDVGAYGQLHFDVDLAWKRDKAEIIELARNADVIHLHNFLNLKSTHFAPIQLCELWEEGRPMLRQFHSAPQVISRSTGESLSEIQECPIPKLVIAQFQARYYPAARIVPNIVFPASAPDQDRPQGTLRIGYAPTRFNSARSSRWDTKGYRETLKMLSKLTSDARRHGLEVQIDIIEQVSHAECLHRKSACHVFIDDLVTGSYHLNTLEALADGSACLTYIDQPVQRAIATLTGRCDFPAINVALEDARETLLNLAGQPGAVESIGAASREWMRTHWAPAKMAEHFLDAYRQVIAAPREPLATPDSSSSAGTRWLDLELPDIIWANRHPRWPRVMPEKVRELRGRIRRALWPRTGS